MLNFTGVGLTTFIFIVLGSKGIVIHFLFGFLSTVSMLFSRVIKVLNLRASNGHPNFEPPQFTEWASLELKVNFLKDVNLSKVS